MHLPPLDLSAEAPSRAPMGGLMSDFSKTGEHSALPAMVIDRLLDLLGSDDAYRQRFHENPATALAEIGYMHDQPHANFGKFAGKPMEGQALYCMTASQLASKEEIQQARAELRSFLTTQANHIVVFAFESGQMDSVLRSK